MGNIGPVRRKVDLEPLPEKSPIAVPEPVTPEPAAPTPEKVPV